jgi:UDP-glucose 4-epimerase
MDKPKLLVIGGTGSLGKELLKHLLNEYTISVFSRDEAKHVIIKQMYPEVQSLIGDIRDRDSVYGALIKSQPDIIINAAALKNVPEVEEVPMEGIKTSLIGTENLNQATLNYSLLKIKRVKVLTISTDKAAKPVNAYGMAKALQERLHIRSNTRNVICNAVRYGNVLESRGSLIPLLKSRLLNNKEVYITNPNMTRFFLTLKSSVDLIKRALEDDEGGKIFIPVIRSAKIIDIINLFCEILNKDKSLIKQSKIRPGEKIDEILISQEELLRTQFTNGVYVIHDILADKTFIDIKEELSSGSSEILLTKEELLNFLTINGIFNV